MLNIEEKWNGISSWWAANGNVVKSRFALHSIHNRNGRMYLYLHIGHKLAHQLGIKIGSSALIISNPDDKFEIGMKPLKKGEEGKIYRSVKFRAANYSKKKEYASHYILQAATSVFKKDITDFDLELKEVKWRLEDGVLIINTREKV